MKIIGLSQIQELAQEFMAAPRVSRGEDDLSIIYDYEMDDGGYDEKGIYFTDILDFRYKKFEDLTPEMIHVAYNAVAEVMDSDWLSAEQNKQGYRHFLMYFDGYRAYEVVARDFRMDIIGYHPPEQRAYQIENNFKNLTLFTLACAFLNLLLGLINPGWIIVSG